MKGKNRAQETKDTRRSKPKCILRNALASMYRNINTRVQGQKDRHLHHKSSLFLAKTHTNEYSYMETENQRRLTSTNKTFTEKAFGLLPIPHLDHSSRPEKACVCVLSSFYLLKRVLIIIRSKCQLSFPGEKYVFCPMWAGANS